jgi:Spy/CpxP family protein refolding chaperone
MFQAWRRGTMKALFNTLPERPLTMKPWIQRTLITTLGAVALAAGLSGCARDHHHGGWSDERVAEARGKVIEKISDKLVLNDAQKQKLAVLADEVLAQRKALKGDTTDPRAQLQALFKGDRFDRDTAQALLAAKTQAVQGQGPKVIDALANFYDSLNPGQQQQVRERMAQRKGWWSRG